MRWDGEGYHRVATVQERWGLQLLRQVPRAHYLRILDAGCGSGRLTAHLLRKFPEAHVIGLDVSGEMLEQARRNLRRFQRRLKLVEGDLLTAKPEPKFELVFSNAVFHWIRDHTRLFQNIHRWLAPGGRLVAQYGGAGNLRRIATLTPLLSKLSLFRRHFRDFRRPLNYAAPSATRMLLREIGFQEIQVRLHKAPTRFSTRSSFRDFVRNVILVPDLSQLPTTDLKEAYVESFLALYEKTFGRPYLLDYVRLTIWAKRGKKESKNSRIQEFRIEARQWDCLLDTHSWILEFLNS